jgi:hypothetical protein
MRMNISVPDELAEQVRALDLSISGICQTALRAAVENASHDTELITVKTGEDYNITKGFYGQWLVAPHPEDTGTEWSGFPAGAYWGVARTKKGRIAVYTAHCDEHWAGRLEDFDSLGDALSSELPEDIFDMAASALGEDYVIMLDI